MGMPYTSNENVGKVRLQAIRMLATGKSTREVARYFGYAQSTIVKWNKRKHEIWRKREVPTRSSRPHTSPNKTSKEIEAKILAVRLQIKRCAEVVHEHLKQEEVHVSLSTVKRVLRRYGVTARRSPWKKNRIYPVRPDIAAQGDLVELDTVHVYDCGKKVYIYTAIDVYSRYAFAWMSTKADTHASLRFLKRVREYFSFTVLCIQTDNGPEFGRWFTDHALVMHRHNHPRSPNENGHLERFNRTLQEEMPKHGLCILLRQDVTEYLEHYNTQRMHMGIGLKTPKQMIK